MDKRALFFVVASVALLVLALSGSFNASSDVTITREEAIEIAYDHVQFEPVNTDARLIRQGFRLTPVWGVSLSIPSEDSSQDFERLNTVEINAQTGEVLRVSVDDIDAVEDDE